MKKSITMCAADECDRKSVSKGYCDKHYRRLRKYGDPNVKKLGNGQKGEAAKMPDAPPEKLCTIEGCTRVKYSRGWCKMHYRRWQRNGDPESTRSERVDDKPCIVDSCEETVRVGEFCYAHYARFKRHSDPLAGKQPAERATDHEDGDRTCNTCKVKKPITDFYRGKFYTRGRWPRCAECHIAWFSNRYQENKAYYDDQARTNRHARRARIAGGQVDPGVTRAKLRKIHGDDCMYCGVTMDFEERGRRQSKTRATVEHIIPIAKGGSHTWDNTALCCALCNSMKGAKTPAEFAAYLEFIDTKEDEWELSA